MSFKKVGLAASLVCATTLCSSANATTYVSEGTSFSTLSAGRNSEWMSGGTFESFTRSMGAHSQLSDAAQDSGAQQQSPGVSQEDTWLMLLIGGALIGLQLRRKQKSLPHQPLAGLTAE